MKGLPEIVDSESCVSFEPDSLHKLLAIINLKYKIFLQTFVANNNTAVFSLLFNVTFATERSLSVFNKTRVD